MIFTGRWITVSKHTCSCQWGRYSIFLYGRNECGDGLSVIRAKKETITFFWVLKRVFDSFLLVLLDDEVQIVAVQCHEEESTFPRRETERRCQKSVDILHIRRISPCEHGFIRTRCLVTVRTCSGDDVTDEDWSCGLVYDILPFSWYSICLCISCNTYAAI